MEAAGRNRYVAAGRGRPRGGGAGSGRGSPPDGATAAPTASRPTASDEGRWESLAMAAFLLLLPLSTYRPIGPPLIGGILDLYSAPVIYLIDIALAALLLATLARRREGRWWRSTPAALALAGLAGLATLLAFRALLPSLALLTALRWWIALGAYLLLARSRMPIERMVTIFLAGLGVQALIGLAQVLVQRPLGLPGEMALPIDAPGAAVLRIGEGLWLRAYGLTFNPNVLGGFLAVGILLALPLLSQWRVRWLWWLLWLGLFASFSRSAWLAVALLLPLAMIWCARREPALRRPFAIAIVGVLLVVLAGAAAWGEQLALRLGGEIATTLQSAREEAPGGGTLSPSVSERVEMNKLAIGVIAARPLTGIGAGNFPVAMLLERMPVLPQYVHNLPLLIAAEVGTPGAGLWLWLSLSPLLTAAAAWRRLDSRAIVTVGAWVALCIIGLFDFYPWALVAGQLLSVTLLSLLTRVEQAA